MLIFLACDHFTTNSQVFDFLKFYHYPLMNMDSLNTNGSEFVRNLGFALKKTESSDETIKTSSAASSLAVAYEAARNAVEFRSEHLIRQAAIVRILRRRLILREPSERVSPLLIRELVWARYLKDDSVPVSKSSEIENIIDKYQISFGLANDETFKSKFLPEGVKDLKEWLLQLAGCEIEESLVFNPYPQLLINFVAESLQPRISIEGLGHEKQKDIQVYIAVERAFAKNSETYISYHLLKAIYPEWFKAKSEETKNIFPDLLKAKKEVDTELNFSLGAELKRGVSKMTAPFNVIREMVIREPEKFISDVENKEEFKKTAEDLLIKLYAENKGRSVRASTRSIIYVFLTKMILGIALELPFDLFMGRTNYLALGVNLLFPPTLMFLLNARITTPDSENTKKIIGKISEYLYSKDMYGIVVIGKKKISTSIIQQIFYFIYLLVFVGIFGFIIWGLSRLHFNIVSLAIFIFFLCVVSFFAYRVRSISKDYVYQEAREGILSSLIDFLFLPIIRVGQWLSGQIAKLNVLGFIFDFIIEAPLKAFLAVLEEWVHFVRAKKEEIFTE